MCRGLSEWRDLEGNEISAIAIRASDCRTVAQVMPVKDVKTASQISMVSSSSAGDFKCAIKEEVTLTSGEWEVLARHGSKVVTSVHQMKALVVAVFL